ncbi:hypothetical protein COT62_01790, partial [Candidatus Roizmanbacteria bacterium CG09_land_8_20_14_0_10_41_9]
MTRLFTPDTVEAYFKKLKESDVSIRVIKEKVRAIRTFLDWAHNKQILKSEEYKQLHETIAKCELIFKKDAQQSFFSIREKFSIHFPKALSFLKPKTKFNVSAFFNDFNTQQYITFSILLIFMAILGAGFYNRFFTKQERSFAYPTTLTKGGRTITFQGRLTDTTGTPINTATNVMFRFWDIGRTGPSDPTGTEGSCAGGGDNCLYKTTVCSVTPDIDGIFNVEIGSVGCGASGSDPSIYPEVFTENADVFLGVSVGTTDPTSEMTPRQQIANVGYAINAETLQGFPAGTGTSAIPYIDSTGTLLIGAASPTVRSSFGTFTIEGQTLEIITPSGSSGNISLMPDSGGNVGIGTTTPLYPLDVGTTNASGIAARFTGRVIGVGASNNDEFVTLSQVQGSASYWTDGGAYLYPSVAYATDVMVPSGNLGVGTTGPFGAGTKMSVIGGNVGIGTTSPLYALDISGSIRVGTTTVLGGNAYSWPSSISAGNYLKTDASGQLSWAAAGGLTVAFTDITSGTNTSAIMTVGNGGVLNYTGTGIINASQLQGATWGAPLAIGSTTASTGVFTTLYANVGATTPVITLTTGAGADRILRSDASGNASWIVQSLITAGSVPFAGVTAGTNVTTLTMGTGGNLNYVGTGVINASQLQGATWGAPLAIGSTTASTGAFTVLGASGTATFSSTTIMNGTIDTPLATGMVKSDTNGILSILAGTNNYLPKWSSSLLTVSSLLYDDGTVVGIGSIGPYLAGSKFVVMGGNVGIGTTSASAKLHIYGAVTTAGTIGDGTNAPDLHIDGSYSSSGHIVSINNKNGNRILTIQGSGNIGIGTTKADALLQVGTSPFPGLAVTSGGRVGIGMTNPGAPLNVQGSDYPLALFERTGTGDLSGVRAVNRLLASTTGDALDGFGPTFWFGIKDATESSGDLGFFGMQRDGGDDSGKFTFATYLSGTAYTRMVILSDGSTGIGTASPDNKLDVSGNMAIGSYAGLSTAPSNGLIISGSVGIGTSLPAYALDLAGAIRVGTTTVFGGNAYTWPGAIVADSFLKTSSTGQLSWDTSVSSPPFSNITSGTNTTAVMTVGSGALLTYTGTGVINASQLQGATWGA